MSDQKVEATNLERTDATPNAEPASAGPVGTEPSPEEAGWVTGAAAEELARQRAAGKEQVPAPGPVLGPDGVVLEEAKDA